MRIAQDRAPPPPAAAVSPAERAFIPGPFTKRLGKVAPGDWLDGRAEPGQTFEEWQASEHNTPDATRRVIYLQPLGDTGPRAVDIETLRQFTAAFFQMPVVVRPSMSTDSDERRPERSTTKTEHDGKVATKPGLPVTFSWLCTPR